MLLTLAGAAVAAKILKQVYDNVKSDQHGSETDPPGIRIGMSADELEDGDFREAVLALLGKGFWNIRLDEIREQRRSFFNKNQYGRIRAVSVNGNPDFRKKDVFPQDAYICVTFDSFKDSPYAVIPELDEAIKAHRRREEKAKEDARGIAYCEYCDSMLAVTALECPHCGAPITRRTRRNV